MEEKEEEQKPTPLFKFKKGPPREQISREEFLHRLETIGEWRKKRLEELRARLRAEGSG